MLAINLSSLLVDDQEKALASDDLDEEFRRLTARGVVFRGEPQESGSSRFVLFEDTGGNLINLYQVL